MKAKTIIEIDCVYYFTFHFDSFIRIVNCLHSALHVMHFKCGSAQRTCVLRRIFGRYFCYCGGAKTEIVKTAMFGTTILALDTLL